MPDKRDAALTTSTSFFMAPMPDEPVMVDLYWHHWELEPPLAHQIRSLIVSVARGHLTPSARAGPIAASGVSIVSAEDQKPDEASRQ